MRIKYTIQQCRTRAPIYAIISGHSLRDGTAMSNARFPFKSRRGYFRTITREKHLRNLSEGPSA
jgi:hypothetical protein